jgi:flagellar hook assembly protein FlgD
VDVEIRDLQGREVQRLSLSRVAGSTTIHWDGRGRNGDDVPAGMYFVRVTAPGRVTESTVNVLR